jgi:hypothetical protein
MVMPSGTMLLSIAVANTANGRLLRACRQRPHRRRAAQQRDELAPLHVLSQAQKTGILTPQTSALIGAEIGDQYQALLSVQRQQ